VCIRKPGMEREHGHFDGEADEEEQEHHDLESRREERLVQRIEAVLYIAGYFGMILRQFQARDGNRFSLVLAGGDVAHLLQKHKVKRVQRLVRALQGKPFGIGISQRRVGGLDRLHFILEDRAEIDEIPHIGEVKAQQSNQDEHAAKERVQEKLDR